MVATPKIGLKHPKAVSIMREFVEGTRFQPVYVNKYGGADVKKVVVCSGKVYFEIQKKFESKQPEHGVIVIRVEELAPFPIRDIASVIQQLP